MVLHQGKVKLEVTLQTHMYHRYPKKDANPSNTTSLVTLVLGLVTSIVCLSLGIDSKNFSIL